MKNQNDAYQTSLDYLYSFVDYSLTRQLRYSPEKFDLNRVREFMSLMGDPHLKYPTIHIAGTKGKGSICAMIATILSQRGLRVGLYTSPHLQEFTERIRINNREISKDEFVEIVERLKPYIKQVRNISTFEITTALAFQYFFENSVDIAVVEVGLGGRLDATNVVNPLVSVISTISKDHEKILGNTLEKIAVEKAGIIKENTPVVISKQKPRIKNIFNEIALKRNAPFYSVEDLLRYRFIHQDLKGQDFIILENDNKQLDVNLPLLGPHQLQNALAAYLAIKLISSKKGFEISPQNIQKGFQNVTWPGRFEILSENPLLVVDSAHNPDSIKMLVKTIRSLFLGKKVIMVFGASEDKDIKGMLKVLLPETDIFISSQSTHPRAMNSTTILGMVKKIGRDGFAVSSVEQAIKMAIDNYDSNSVILVTGSIFIVAAVREIWLKRNKEK